MKTVKKLNLKQLQEESKILVEIEEKLLKTTKQLTEREITFLEQESEKGVPIGEFLYGLYFLLEKNDEKAAEIWWNKYFYHANGFGLWRASGIFAYLGDEFYEWSMKCLRRSAWRQFKLSKMMLKEMKEHPFRFPEA